MANKTLFQSLVGRLAPAANTRNEAGGTAYAFSPEHALAQFAATGCLNGTFYATAQDQLQTVLQMTARVDHNFIARVAIWCRTHGHMKDMPALLMAVLTQRDGALCEKIFPRVIDNGKMLRNFVQIMRSGITGRKSLGTRPRRMIRAWLESQPDEAIFRASIGNDPSLADIIRMVHPRPSTPTREALYAYLLGREHNTQLLPPLVQAFEAFKSGKSAEVPDVPFEMLTALPLTDTHWMEIARHAPWQMTRMNLNTFARHNVFNKRRMRKLIAERLRNKANLQAARVFPYQLMAAYTMTGPDVPGEVRDALHDALEIATQNVPAVSGRVYVMTDVSGSMHSAVTGYRRGSTSAVRCIDVAALVAACVLRQNPQAEIIPFHDRVVEGVRLSSRDSVLTNAQLLASLPSGGTNCSAPLCWLNSRSAKGDLVIYVSDNESWVDVTHGRGTATMQEWEKFRVRNPQARMVCIDVQPYATTQAQERADVLNIGGFSDQVFQVVAQFAAGELSAGHWVDVINAVEL